MINLFNFNSTLIIVIEFIFSFCFGLMITTTLKINNNTMTDITIDFRKMCRKIARRAEGHIARSAPLCQVECWLGFSNSS